MGTGNSVSNFTDTSSSSISRGSNGHGCQTFARTHDHRKVSFMDDCAHDETADMEPTDGSDDIDLIDNVLDQYNVNFATLCANVAKQKNSELVASGKHAHYHPPKCTLNLWMASIPPSDVQQLLTDMVSLGEDLKFNGVPYTAKKVGSSPALMDINLEVVTYAVRMADLTTYHVPSMSHFDMTGPLVNQGANGGITGGDCCIIKVNDQPQCFSMLKESMGTS
jgi:hypothetical protein